MNNQQKPQLPPMPQQQQLQQPTNPTVVSSSGNIFQPNRNQIGQSQFLRQSPSPQTAAVPSPVGLNQQQMQTPQMIPSPALVPSSSPQMANIMTNNQRSKIFTYFLFYYYS